MASTKFSGTKTGVRELCEMKNIYLKTEPFFEVVDGFLAFFF